MTAVPVRRGHKRKKFMQQLAEMGAMQLQAKEHQGSQPQPEAKSGMEQTLSEPPEGTNLANTWILDFHPPEL